MLATLGHGVTTIVVMNLVVLNISCNNSNKHKVKMDKIFFCRECPNKVRGPLPMSKKHTVIQFEPKQRLEV
jgi:hypothetical protein